jgi:5-methylcytosine-specific restriction endonuclease McrA
VARTAEDIKIYMHEYYLKNKDRMDSANREWAIKNSEKNKEYHKKYYQDNKEKIYKNNLEWKRKNREKYLEFSRVNMRKYNRENPERVRQRNKVRNLKRGSNPISRLMLQTVYEDNIKKYGTLTCYLCLKPIEFGEDHIDHMMTVSRGGSSEISNLSISCPKCNLSKYNKTVEEFMGGLNARH